MSHYAEIDNLFVEHDLEDARWGHSQVVITNVQLKHPANPEDTSKWIDITDHLPAEALAQLVSQIDDEYVDKYHRAQACIEDAADARREFAREIQAEELAIRDSQRGNR